MALIKCTECGKEISENAASCPHCGNPIKPVQVEAKKKSSPGCAIALVIVFLLFMAGTIMIDLEPAEMVGYYKKELANGSNKRVYSFFVKEFDKNNPEMWQELEEQAKDQMYTNGGLTVVLFFKDKSTTPDVTMSGLEFPKKYEPYCVAGYWKYPNGNERFFKYPFKD